MTDIERSWADQPRTRSLPTTTERTTTMKHFTKTRIAATAVASAASLVMAGGVAYAFWNSTGAGTGTSKAGTITFTVNATGPAFGSGATAHPGSVAGGSGDTLGGDLYVSINNTSGYSLKVTQIAQTGLATVTANPNGTCASDVGTLAAPTTSNLAAFIGTQAPNPLFGAATNGALGTTYTLAAPVTIATGTNTYQLVNVVGMGTASISTCQGATFTFPVTVTATS